MFCVFPACKIYILKQTRKPKLCTDYYTVIKHSGHLKTLEKCRKYLPEACVFYISLVFSNARCVLYITYYMA